MERRQLVATLRVVGISTMFAGWLAVAPGAPVGVAAGARASSAPSAHTYTVCLPSKVVPIVAVAGSGGDGNGGNANSNGGNATGGSTGGSGDAGNATGGNGGTATGGNGSGGSGGDSTDESW